MGTAHPPPAPPATMLPASPRYSTGSSGRSLPPDGQPVRYVCWPWPRPSDRTRSARWPGPASLHSARTTGRKQRRRSPTWRPTRQSTRRERSNGISSARSSRTRRGRSPNRSIGSRRWTGSGSRRGYPTSARPGGPSEQIGRRSRFCSRSTSRASPRKSGCEPDAALALAEKVATLPGLTLRGLMAIPEATGDSARQRAAFAAVRELSPADR